MIAIFLLAVSAVLMLLSALGVTVSPTGTRWGLFFLVIAALAVAVKSYRDRP